MLSQLKQKSFFGSFIKNVFQFSTVKKPLNSKETLIKPLWRNIYKKLQVYQDEKENLLKKLNQESDSIPSRSKEAYRIRINDLEPISALFDKYQNIFSGIDELDEMGKSSPDKETIQFINEETENYKELLVELEEKAIDFLIPKDRFDECQSINLEIRPGHFILFF